VNNKWYSPLITTGCEYCAIFDYMVFKEIKQYRYSSTVNISSSWIPFFSFPHPRYPLSSGYLFFLLKFLCFTLCVCNSKCTILFSIFYGKILNSIFMENAIYYICYTVFILLQLFSLIIMFLRFVHIGTCNYDSLVLRANYFSIIRLYPYLSFPNDVFNSSQLQVIQ
jgi:hypothetical protein